MMQGGQVFALYTPTYTTWRATRRRCYGVPFGQIADAIENEPEQFLVDIEEKV